MINHYDRNFIFFAASALAAGGYYLLPRWPQEDQAWIVCLALAAVYVAREACLVCCPTPRQQKVWLDNRLFEGNRRLAVAYSLVGLLQAAMYVFAFMLVARLNKVPFTSDGLLVAGCASFCLITLSQSYRWGTMRVTRSGESTGGRQTGTFVEELIYFRRTRR